MKRTLFGMTLLTLVFTLAVFQPAAADEEAQEKFWRTEYIHVGPNWAAIHKLKPSEKTFRVKVRGDDAFKLGETLDFKVKSKKSGQLWVVQVDPADEMTLMVPNARSSTSKIKTGS